MNKEFTEKDIKDIASTVKMMTDADKDLIPLMNKVNMIESKINEEFEEIDVKITNHIPIIMRSEDIMKFNKYLTDLEEAYKNALNYSKEHPIYNPMIKELLVIQLKNSDKKFQIYMQMWEALSKAAIIIK